MNFSSDSTLRLVCALGILWRLPLSTFYFAVISLFVSLYYVTESFL